MPKKHRASHARQLALFHRFLRKIQGAPSDVVTVEKCRVDVGLDEHNGEMTCHTLLVVADVVSGVPIFARIYSSDEKASEAYQQITDALSRRRPNAY